MRVPVIVVHILGKENQTRNLVIAQQLRLKNVFPGYDTIIVSGVLNRSMVHKLIGNIIILQDKYEGAKND